MANYQHKRSPVAGKIPLAGDLLEGEIAVNIKDRKLFSKDDQGTVFEFLGGNSGGVDTVNGVAPVAGNVTLNALNIPPTANRLWLTQTERQLIAGFDAYDKVESDDRYLLEANNLSDLTNVTTARTNLGLGTAAARDVGEVAGNVMEVGAFGLGLSRGLRVPNDNADSLNITGIYSTTGVWTGSPYTGTNERNQGTLYHSQSFHNSDTYAVQTFIPMVSVDKVFFRRKTNSVWFPWQEIYHTGNILGTVSQSGGVPTGAIIESGSNANGEYTKYADGTMICTISNAIFTRDAAFRLLYTWTYPAQFIKETTATSTILSGYGTDNTNLSVVDLVSKYRARATSTLTDIQFVTSVDSIGMESRNASLTAIGRWF